MKTAVLLFGIGAVIASLITCASAEGKSEAMQRQYRELSAKIDSAFAATDARDLPSIEAQIKAFGLQPGENSHEWRADKLRLWIRLVANANSASDLNSAPNDRPSRNIAPPSTSEAVYDSGVDPSAIKDPKVREQYEQRLKENSQKAQKARFQSELQRLQGGWTAALKSHVSSQYSASGEDVAEIDAVLNQDVSDDEFRTRLRASLLKVL
jgi:hypothetical protein